MDYRRILSWITSLPHETPNRQLDKILLPILRTLYLVRIKISGDVEDSSAMVIRLAQDKYRRHSSPAYAIGRAIYMLSKRLGIPSSGLLAIASEFGYRYYCRLDKLDFNPSVEQVMRFFEPKEGDIVIDVGAHVGRYTLLACSKVGAAGKVIAIEADPETHKILQRNIKLNRFSNALALNCAAYSRKCSIDLYLPQSESGQTIYNTIIASRSSFDLAIKVDANTLDDIIKENDLDFKVNWIKIDVEGAELEVLRGAHNILLLSSDIHILVEIHKVTNTLTLYPEIIDLLAKYSYRVAFEETYSSGEKHVIFVKENPNKG